MFSLSLSLSLFLSIFFFLFAPTILCLIIHLYHAVDTYVRELFPSASVTRMCVCVCDYYERKLSQVRLSFLLRSFRAYLSLVFCIFFFFFSSFFKAKIIRRKVQRTLIVDGNDNEEMTKLTSRKVFQSQISSLTLRWGSSLPYVML